MAGRSATVEGRQKNGDFDVGAELVSFGVDSSAFGEGLERHSQDEEHVNQTDNAENDELEVELVQSGVPHRRELTEDHEAFDEVYGIEESPVGDFTSANAKFYLH